MVTDARPEAAATANRTGSRSPRVKLSWGPETISLQDEETFGTAGAELSSLFLRRVFSVEEVRSVHIDRAGAKAEIRYARGKLGLADLLQRLAGAMRGGPAEGVRLLPLDLSRKRLAIYRHGDLLSSWEVLSEQPGVLALRHEMISSDRPMARRVAQHVESFHGVKSSVLSLLGGQLHIRFDPAQTRAERLLRALEAAPESLPAVAADPSEPALARFGLVNTAVAASVLTDYFIPSLWPATAALLLGSNLRNFRDAAVQLGSGQVGLPVLYTSIAAATLTSGQFLPWALMNWMLRFWKHRYQHQLSSARRRLLGDVILQERFARVEAGGGVHVEVPVQRLAPGDLILVSAGEKLAVDGRIVQGRGLLDERVVLGTSGISRKGPDEHVFAGTLLMEGELQVETRLHGPGTRAAALARAALAAITHQPGIKTPTLKGERFASRLVAPTLATAGLGLYLAGPPMALAIMDTDYASGPGMAYSLEALQALAVFSRQGIVVRDVEAIDQMAQTDVLLLEHHPSLEVMEPEVASVRVFPGHTEYRILRYAASALRNLEDERAVALRAACRSRRITLLDRIPTEYGADVTMIYKTQVIKVGNLGGQGPSARKRDGHDRVVARTIDSLMVGVNGQIAGLVDFRASARPLAASALRELRARMRHPLAIGLVSQSRESQVGQLAAALGVDFHEGNVSSGNLVQLIRGCRQRGLKVAFAGNCLINTRAAREADVAISLDPSGLENFDRNPASILLLEPDLARLGTLYEVSRIHRQRILAAQGSAWIPNLLCVGGAFFLGSTSLATVAITNLGTYSTYARSTAAIRSLERQFARARGRHAVPLPI
jgi:cation transport ATPase